MNKNILCLIIGLLLVCNTSTASANVVGIVLDIVKAEITITYENHVDNDKTKNGKTTVWIKVNEDLLVAGAKGYKLRNSSGVETFKIDYDLITGDTIRITWNDTYEKKCIIDEFTITRNIHTMYY